MRYRSLLFASLLLGAAGARADVTSTFDIGNEGWKTLRIDTNTLTPLDPVPPDSGWDAAGYLRNTEASGGLFTLSAPAAYLGAKSSYFGGSVSYDLSDATADSGATLGFFLVKSDLSVALGYPQALTPGAAQTFTVPLKADGKWIRYNGASLPSVATDADLKSALSSLGYLGINADWTTATADVTTLDNVKMAQPVPEPATLAALAAGGLALLRRRR